MTFELPENLARITEQHGSADQREWMARLPETVSMLAQRWGLVLERPYQPGGWGSWTAPARDPRGRAVVLKAGWTHYEARDEAAGLRAWAGRGAVELYDEYVNGPTTALLLERCEPGTTLKALPYDEQDLVVAEMLRSLWEAPIDGHTGELASPSTGHTGELASRSTGHFRPLQSMCDAWADAFERKRPSAVDYDLDPGLVRDGLALWRELPTSAERVALLATDLHGDNILAAARRPWLLIDPKPYVGDPTYDALQHMLNRPLLPDPEPHLRRMAALLDLDASRLRQWLLARCVVESIDWLPLRPVARLLAGRM
jgi:streptomycin 6-kinase